jgi:hypothetical protein
MAVAHECQSILKYMPLAIATNFHSSLLFVSKAYPSGSLTRVYSKEGYLPKNIRLASKWPAVTKALAYNTAVLFATVKSFIAQAAGLTAVL